MSCLVISYTCDGLNQCRGILIGATLHKISIWLSTLDLGGNPCGSSLGKTTQNSFKISLSSCSKQDKLSLTLLVL